MGDREGRSAVEVQVTLRPALPQLLPTELPAPNPDPDVGDPLRQDDFDCELLGVDSLEGVLEADVPEVEGRPRVEEVAVGVDVVAELPVGLPAPEEGEPGHEADPDEVGGIVAEGLGGGDVADLVEVVQPPDLVGKVEVDALEGVLDVVALGAEGDPRELPLQRGALVYDLVALGDADVAPVGNLDDLLDGGELDLGVVVDPEDSVPDPGEGLQAARAELHL